tara:strand:+ start:1420 stop:1665 length:246 start_codon:yes stop_codon:yes gene_type:complete
MSSEKTDVLRLRKKHLLEVSKEPTPEDAKRLLRAQSVRNAIMASIITIILFSVVWAMLSTLVGSIYPWMTLLLGILVGLGV